MGPSPDPPMKRNLYSNRILRRVRETSHKGAGSRRPSHSQQPGQVPPGAPGGQGSFFKTNLGRSFFLPSGDLEDPALLPPSVPLSGGLFPECIDIEILGTSDRDQVCSSGSEDILSTPGHSGGGHVTPASVSAASTPPLHGSWALGSGGAMQGERPFGS